MEANYVPQTVTRQFSSEFNGHQLISVHWRCAVVDCQRFPDLLPGTVGLFSEELWLISVMETELMIMCRKWTEKDSLYSLFKQHCVITPC